MLEFVNLHNLYLVCAVIGGASFLLRTILQFIGGDGLLEGGADALDADIDSLEPGDTDASFKFLSIQGAGAFAMMFGLVGLAMLYQSPFPEIASILAALLAGFASVWLIGHLFAFAYGLQSRGNVELKNAVGREGRVYLRIPPGGVGQVELTVQGRLRVLDARAIDQATEIASGTLVRVASVVGEEQLIVKIV
ncbi:MAG: hypothetical protein NXI24_22575 [bacterium]|nr:hypothetical protein [bacterium]